MEITLFRNWIAARRWTFPNRITLIQFASRQRHFHSSAIQCMNRSFHLLLILCVFETLRCHKRMPEWNWFSHWVCRSGWQNQIFAEDITQFTNNYVIKINFYCHPVRQLVFFSRCQLEQRRDRFALCARRKRNIVQNALRTRLCIEWRKICKWKKRKKNNIFFMFEVLEKSASRRIITYSKYSHLGTCKYYKTITVWIVYSCHNFRSFRMFLCSSRCTTFIDA